MFHHQVRGKQGFAPEAGNSEHGSQCGCQVENFEHRKPKPDAFVDATEWSRLRFPTLFMVADWGTEETIDTVDAHWQKCNNYIKRISILVEAEKVPVRESRICVWKGEREMLEDNS